MNINNGKTGNVNIPGALHSTGGDGDGQVGGVVAYAGDVYDETLGKNQKEINQTLLDGSADSNVIAVALNDLNEKVEEQEKVTSSGLNDLNDKIDNFTQSASNVSFDDSVAHLGTQENPITNVQAAINAAVTGFASLESNIPTKVSDLTNDSGYLTQHQTLPDIADDVTTSDATKVLSAKQGKLLNDRVTTLENAEITAEDVSYDSTETYTSGTVGYAIKQLETASGGAGTSPSGGISQSPQSGTNLSPNRTSTLFDQSTNHDKLVPAEVSTSLGQNSACSGKDTYSTGVSSFASGDNVLAKGDNSAAFGEGSFAFGDGSVSVGVNDVMPCYIYVSEDSSYTGGSPRRYDVTIQPTKSLQNYDKEEILDNMIIAIMPNHVDNIVDGIVYAQLFDVYFDIDAEHNRFGQYMNAKVYISDEDREVPYEHDGQQMTHTIGESVDAYYGLLCRSANGKSSATIGKNLMTSNEGEVAVGNSNVSHKKQTNLAGTIFSVGARGLVSKAERSNTDYDEWAQAENYDPQYEDDTTVANVNAFFNTADCSSPSNALEVLDDGKVFIRGIGGFNGLNSTASGVKSVQEVIADLTQQIAALSNN